MIECSECGASSADTFIRIDDELCIDCHDDRRKAEQ